jgi:hypothetical protein
VGGWQLLLAFVAIIVITFAALELREAHGLGRAPARGRRRKWPAAGPPACSCGNPVPEICESPLAAPGEQEREREMNDTNRARLGVIVVAGLFVTALGAMSACATLRRQDAVGTAQLLAKAGFQKRNADSPEQARSLASMPPFKIVARGVGRDVAYTYADPVNCRCLYVGGPRQYVEYQRLATEREVAEGEPWAETDGMDWALWGGWLQ